MSDSESANTLFLEVMITSKNERVFIRDLSDLTLQIIFDAWWDSTNVGWKGQIASKNYRHVPSWRFYLHYWIQDTGCPRIICIICHEVYRHSTDHGTISIGKHLPVNAQIAKVNESTESEVPELTSSMVAKAALATLKRQGCWGITIVSSQKKFIFNIPVLPILTELKGKTL